MATWPFSIAFGAGLVNNDVPTHSQLNKLDEQHAQAADGAQWTDVAQVANFVDRFTNAVGGRQALYNPFLKKFFSFNDSSGNPLGFSMPESGVVKTTLTIPAGDGCAVDFGFGGCAVDPATGKMILVGHPFVSSQSRIRSSTDGVTWTARNSAKAASTLGPQSAIWAGGTINKFFTGYFEGQIESSPDGVTWTNEAVGASPKSAAAFSPTLNLIVWVNASGTATATSDNGTTWTARATPVAFSQVMWSAHHGKFFAAGNASMAVYSSVDGITWSAAIPLGFGSGGTIGRMFGGIGRLMGMLVRHAVVGDPTYLIVTLDEWATNIKVTDFISPDGAKGGLAQSDKGQLLISDPGGFHMVSLRLGL